MCFFFISQADKTHTVHRSVQVAKYSWVAVVICNIQLQSKPYYKSIYVYFFFKNYLVIWTLFDIWYDLTDYIGLYNRKHIWHFCFLKYCYTGSLKTMCRLYYKTKPVWSWEVFSCLDVKWGFALQVCVSTTLFLASKYIITKMVNLSSANHLFIKPLPLLYTRGLHHPTIVFLFFFFQQWNCPWKRFRKISQSSFFVFFVNV